MNRLIRTALCASAFVIASNIISPSQVHAKPFPPGVSFFLPLAEIPLSSQQKLRALEEKINAIAEGRLKLKLKDDVQLQLPDIPTLRGVIINRIPAGPLKTNLFALLSDVNQAGDANPVGVAFVSAYLFYANNLNPFLAAYWSDQNNFVEETSEGRVTGPSYDKSGNLAGFVWSTQAPPQTPSSEPKLTDSGRLPDAQNPQGETRGKSLADKFFDAQSAKKPVVKKVAKEGTVIFRGEQIKVNQDYLPIDEKGLESVKTKLFWLIELNPGDLPEYIRVLSLDELRVFNSVISTLISNHSNPILEKSDVRRMLRERFEALQGNEPTIPFEK